jgi:hypothetical protein
VSDRRGGAIVTRWSDGASQRRHAPSPPSARSGRLPTERSSSEPESAGNSIRGSFMVPRQERRCHRAFPLGSSCSRHSLESSAPGAGSEFGSGGCHLPGGKPAHVVGSSPLPPRERTIIPRLESVDSRGSLVGSSSPAVPSLDAAVSIVCTSTCAGPGSGARALERVVPTDVSIELSDG